MPHVARYFLQRAYDSAFEPSSKKSKTDWEKSSDDNENETNKSKHVKPGANDDFLSGADFVPLSGTSKQLSDDTRNKSYKSDHVRPGANDRKLRDADYVPSSGTYKQSSNDNKNKSYKSNHVRPGANEDFIRSADFVPLSGRSNQCSDDYYNKSYKGDCNRSEGDDNYVSSVDYVLLSGPSNQFSSNNKNESYRSNHARPGVTNNLLWGADFVPFSGTSNQLSDFNKNESHRSNHVKPGAANFFLRSADFVPLSGPSNQFSSDNKNESYRSKHVRPGASNDFITGADFVPLSEPSNQFSSDNKNESYRSNHVRPGASNNFIRGPDYVPLPGTSNQSSADNKNESYRSNHVRLGGNNDFIRGADYVPLSGPSNQFSSDNKNESYRSNHVRPGAHNDFKRGADFLPLSRRSNQSSDDYKNKSSYKGKHVRPGAHDNSLSGADFVPLSGSSNQFTDGNESYKSNHIRPGANNDFLSGADYVALLATSNQFSEGYENKSYKGEHVRPGPGVDYVPSMEKSNQYSGDNKHKSYTSDHVRAGVSDFLTCADFVPLSGTPKHFPDDCKNESHKANLERPGGNGADYVPLSGTSTYFSDDGKNELYKKNQERPGGNYDTLSGADDVPLSGASKPYSSVNLSIKKEYSDGNQHNLSPKTDTVESITDSEVAFSQTSTAFIGPVFQPPPQSVTKDPHNATNDPSSYNISTVGLGSSARQSNAKTGMDYELRAFYKELSELDSVTDDQNLGQTIAEHQQVPHCSNSAPSHTQDNPIQTHVPQPCNSSPPKPPDFIPLNSHLNEDSVSPARCHILSPNNHNTCNRPEPFKEQTPSFVSQTLPFPGFQGPPPPSFVLRYCAPPPRHDFPMQFPPESNKPHSRFSENNYFMGNPNLHRPQSQPPCNSPASSESRFSPQGHSYTKPLLEPPAKSSQQEHYQGDVGEWRGRQIGELLFPPIGNGPHEENSNRFGDHVPCSRSAKKLVLLRGVPGSGKSTLARTLLSQSPEAIVLSTDDYFCQENGYTYDVKLLGDAHSWNHNRARKAMDDGRSPIIIDNTNIQSWEMKPYVHMALDHSYDIEFLEPNTWWKLDPNELEKRNTHRVPREKISQMLERYEPNMTVGMVMNSMEPRRVRSNRPPPEARPRWGASIDFSQHSRSFHNR